MHVCPQFIYYRANLLLFISVDTRLVLYSISKAVVSAVSKHAQRYTSIILAKETSN